MLLQALNTGHSGSLCTLHANSARQAIARFSDSVLQSGIELPHRAIMANIAVQRPRLAPVTNATESWIFITKLLARPSGRC
jgi:Flp pilus assembly CpaF family ATPase